MTRMFTSTPTQPMVSTTRATPIEPTNTSESGETRTPHATGTALPPTRTAADLPPKIARLGTLTLGVDRFVDPRQAWDDLRGLVVETRDATAELGESCLWDCSRTVLVTESGEMTVSVIQAGDPEKAERTLESIKRELSYGEIYEYSVDEFASLTALAPNAWVVERRNGVNHDSISGASRGVAVVWVIYSYDICGEREGMIYCEGDTLYLSSVAARVAEMQLETLMAAGY